MSQYLKLSDSERRYPSLNLGTNNCVAREPVENAFELFSEISHQIRETQKNLERKICYLNTRMRAVDEARAQEHQQQSLMNEALVTLIDLMPMGIICLNTQGCISEVNQTANNLFDIDIQGRLWREVIVDEFSPKVNDGHEISLKNGRVVSIQTRPLSVGPEAGISLAQILIIQDMTETREYQEKLSRERRVLELGKMSASLAHQIRTPLSAAILYANNLDHYKLESGQRKKTTRKLLTQLVSIEKQIRDMLFYLKGEIPIEERSLLNELITMVVQRIEGVSETKCAQVTLDINLPRISINCHEEALVGAISNLLCNAVEASHALHQPKAGTTTAALADDGVDDLTDKGVKRQGVKQPKNGRVEFASYVENHQWVMKIKDNGLGISATEMTQLFTPFYTTKKNGNGLGLTTARAIIESHGGQLSIQSEQNCGTLVEVKMPLNRATQTSEKSTEALQNI